MTRDSSARSVTAASAPFEHYLIAVPRFGDDVCPVCHSAVYDGHGTCYPCAEAERIIGPMRLDAVGFVSLAPAGGQLARDLYTYKLPRIPDRIRRRLMLGLAAVLWRWLDAHESCLAHAAVTDGFDLVTFVPSAGGRTADHPLVTVVGGLVDGTGERTSDVLRLKRERPTPHRQYADRFAATCDLGGHRVLLIDDTWTTGANMQSAAAALKRAGADTVAGVAIGRWLRTDYKGNAAWLARALRTTWTWETCCAELTGSGPFAEA